MPQRLELPYQPDSRRLFSVLREGPWSIWLDSGPRPAAGPERQARYDIMVARPYDTLTIDAVQTDPFDVLRKRLGPARKRAFEDIPFCGGAVGYFGYDLARHIEHIPTHSKDDLKLPVMAIGLYDWAVVVDHQRQRSWLVCQGEHTEPEELQSLHQHLLATSDREEVTRFTCCGPLQSDLARDAYGQAFRRVQHYLREGDCYQVNLARRFSAVVQGDPWGFYVRLRERSPAPFGAWMELPGLRVLSVSPERFLCVRGGTVETRPIKGTVAREDEPQLDQAACETLQASTKDRAENLMIVDLLRNDLGRSCRTGSVHVPELFAVESYATVHHLVSTVRGELDERLDALELLRRAFPGGSITGAPKLRAMQVIEELERHRRGVYCGAIGYLGVDGDMDTNIAIRTAVHLGDAQAGQLHFWAGGGLVVDSQEELEYRETEAKARAFIELLACEEKERSQ